MTKTDIIEWLQREFKPLQLATPDETLSQVVDNAIRYWNTHSGYKIGQMYNATGARIQIDPQFKMVVQVFPNTAVAPLIVNFPTTLLLGMTILDNVTTDMILMSEAYKTYKNYIGGDFRWWYNKSDDPAVGGYLYMSGLPQGVDRLFVVGTKRVMPNENIKPEYVLDWVLNYSKALLKMIEGNTLRKADIIGVRNDGDRLVDEGLEAQKTLQDNLARDGRWVVLARRA
jgi:hypothetical protein